MNRKKQNDLGDLSKIRALFVTDSYSGFGGTWTYYHDLVEYLSSYLNRVELLCPPPKDSYRYKKSVSFPMPGDKTQKVFFPNLQQISKTIQRFRPHVIVISTPGPYGIICMFQAIRFGVNLFVVFQTEFDKLTNIYWNRILYRLSKMYLDGIFKMFFRVGKLVIIPNPKLKKRIHEMGAHRIEIMGTPIGKDFLNDPADYSVNQIKSVLFLGRLAQEKNVEEILYSAQQLHDINFVIAGKGPFENEVVEQSKSLDNLEFLGWVSRSTALSLIDQTDMLLLPSKVESFGTVALEAMSRGKLALVSPECGIAFNRVLKQGLFQIEPGETLTDAIDRIKSMDQKSLIQMANLAKRSSLTYHTETINKWLELIALSHRK